MSPLSNLQKSFNPELLDPGITPLGLNTILREVGCSGCDLGEQSEENKPVVYRGSLEANIMVLGEAPGLEEMKSGRPFTGPAGELLDRQFKSIGLDTEKDCYISNCVLCRPIAPLNSGRQNLKPLVKHKKACKPYILYQIEKVDPAIIVLVGKTALTSLLPEYADLKDWTGQALSSQNFPTRAFFTLVHPAALLHNQRFPDKYRELRAKVNKHLLTLKSIIEDL
jgi:DNA polymerase